MADDPKPTTQNLPRAAVKLPDGSVVDMTKPGSSRALADVLFRGVFQRMVARYKARGEPLPPKALATAKELGIEV